MRSLFVVLAAAIVGCTTPRVGTAPHVTVGEIDSLDARFNRWIVAGQVDSMVNVYFASDAALIVAGSPVLRGRDQIRAVYEGFYKVGTLRGRIQRTSIIVADSIASDFGRYSLEIRDKADSAKVLVSDHGNYVTTFVRRNGSWSALYDASVSEIPPPAPAPKNADKSK